MSSAASSSSSIETIDLAALAAPCKPPVRKKVWKPRQAPGKKADGSELYDEWGQLKTSQVLFPKLGGGGSGPAKTVVQDDHLERKNAKALRRKMRRDGELPPKSDEYKWVKPEPPLTPQKGLTGADT